MEIEDCSFYINRMNILKESSGKLLAVDGSHLF